MVVIKFIRLGHPRDIGCHRFVSIPALRLRSSRSSEEKFRLIVLFRPFVRDERRYELNQNRVCRCNPSHSHQRSFINHPSGALEASPLLKQDPCDALTQPCHPTTKRCEAIYGDNDFDFWDGNGAATMETHRFSRDFVSPKSADIRCWEERVG